MRSHVVAARMRQKAQIGADRAAGMPPARILRMSSHRTADAQVLNVYRLPSVPNGHQLQDATGQMIYLPGYSDPAGPDIGAPG